MESSEAVIGQGFYDQLNAAGYLVLPVLSEETAVSLSRALIKKTVELIFTKKGYSVDSANYRELKCLVDKPLRSKLGPGADTAVWRNGNTRQPIINKSTGMIDLHFQPELLETVTFNPKIVAASAKVMSVAPEKLVYAWGPERVSIKVQGATVMKKHLDANLFTESLNYAYRIQSLVTLSIDTTISADKSGTLNVLTHFHHFWQLAGVLFHPETGIADCRFPSSCLKSRFMELPSYFDSQYLDQLKHYGRLYIDYLNSGCDTMDTFGKYPENLTELFDSCYHADILVDYDLIKLSIYLEEMNWQSIQAKPGDMIFWHQHLPHRSMPNKSLVPRVVAYVNLYPAGANWNSSFQRQWVAQQFRKAESYYVKNADDLRATNVGVFRVTNLEEHQELTDMSKLESIAAMSTKDDFRKRLSGQLPV